MIEVIAEEQARTFEVKIGKKTVGRVVAGPGWATGYARIYREGWNSAFEERSLYTYKNVRRAVRSVLEHLGYGKPQGVKVERAALTRRD